MNSPSFDFTDFTDCVVAGNAFAGLDFGAEMPEQSFVNDDCRILIAEDEPTEPDAKKPNIDKTPEIQRDLQFVWEHPHQDMLNFLRKTHDWGADATTDPEFLYRTEHTSGEDTSTAPSSSDTDRPRNVRAEKQPKSKAPKRARSEAATKAATIVAEAAREIRTQSLYGELREMAWWDLSKEPHPDDKKAVLALGEGIRIMTTATQEPTPDGVSHAERLGMDMSAVNQNTAQTARSLMVADFIAQGFGIVGKYLSALKYGKPFVSLSDAMRVCPPATEMCIYLCNILCRCQHLPNLSKPMNYFTHIERLFAVVRIGSEWRVLRTDFNGRTVFAEADIERLQEAIRPDAYWLSVMNLMQKDFSWVGGVQTTVVGFSRYRNMWQMHTAQ